jgi:hypothetical protein
MGRQYLARLAANRIGERLPLPLARTRARGRDAAPGQTRSERGRSASSRLTPWSDERAENPDGQQELQAHPETPGAVPAEAVVKELPATDAGRGRRGRGRGRNLPRRQASPGRVGLRARQGEGCLRRRWRSQGDASGSPGAAGGRPRGAGGAPQVAICSPRRRRRPLPRGARRSLPFLADCARSTSPPRSGPLPPMTRHDTMSRLGEDGAPHPSRRDDHDGPAAGVGRHVRGSSAGGD